MSGAFISMGEGRRVKRLKKEETLKNANNFFFVSYLV